MTLPLVSAVMIVRDGERFIEEAIESVLAQTYPALELVVVDDGSTDSTGSILERLSEDASRGVQVVRHPGNKNRGMSASRTLGVARSFYNSWILNVVLLTRSDSDGYGQ